jgi:hypothetical protein
VSGATPRSCPFDIIVGFIDTLKKAAPVTGDSRIAVNKKFFKIGSGVGHGFSRAAKATKDAGFRP